MVAIIVLTIAAFVVLGGRQWVHGYALYHGHIPLAGRILGHTADLPPAVLLCANCHDPEPGIAGAGRPTVVQISPLDAGVLLEPLSRRGGPATAYDRDGFCEIVRTGIDPGQIMIDRTMPRFDIDDEACSALWTYVTSR